MADVDEGPPAPAAAAPAAAAAAADHDAHAAASVDNHDAGSIGDGSIRDKKSKGLLQSACKGGPP